MVYKECKIDLENLFISSVISIQNLLNTFINFLLFFKFIQKLSKYRGIIYKYDILRLALCLKNYFFKLLFYFHTVSTRYVQLSCFLQQLWHCLPHLFFVISSRLQKFTVHAFFYTANYPSSESLNMFHCWLYASMDTLQHIFNDLNLAHEKNFEWKNQIAQTTLWYSSRCMNALCTFSK